MKRLLALALLGLLATGCPDDSKDGEDDGVAQDDGGDDAEDDASSDDGGDDGLTPNDCDYRDVTSPPTFAWSFDTLEIGQTVMSYYATPGATGLVVLLDGGGGSRVWFNRIEYRNQVEQLVDAGFAVLALEASSGDDGNFDATDSDTNPDIQNLLAALDTAAGAGIPTSPLYYLGFSSGGAFASLATRYAPANAMALFNVRGDPATFDGSHGDPPPTVWVLSQNDVLVPPDDDVALTNMANIGALGIDSEYYLNTPIGMTGDAFTRISDGQSTVSEQDSIVLVDSLRASGYIDECGVPQHSSAEVDAARLTFGATLQAEGFKDEVSRQFDEMYAAHELTSDFAPAVVTFFALHP